MFFYHFPEKEDKNATIARKIVAIYQENKGNYGYRRIALTLRQTLLINHKKVQRIL